jgi:hypothetical protein
VANNYPGRVGTKRVIGIRSAIVAGAIAAVVCASVALAAARPGYRLVNTHKVSSVATLGKAPKACSADTGSPCIEKGSYGSVSFTPHILKPGGILTGTVTPTVDCHDCLATWPVTGTVTDNVLEFLHRLKGCGALSCRWRLAKDAPAEPYLVIGMDISPRPAANGPSDVSSYAGVRSSWKYKYFQ